MSVRARGMGLVVVLLVSALVAIMVATVVATTSLNLGTVRRVDEHASAQLAAYSGLQAGLAQLSQLETWAAGFAAEQALPSSPDQTYTLEVKNNIAGSEPDVAADGTPIPVGQVYLRAEGRLRSGPRLVLTALADKAQGFVFRNAAFGESSVTLGAGARVRALPNGNAKVATNSVSDGAISMGASSFVEGDLVVGPGADPALAIDLGPGANFSGEAYPSSGQQQIPALSGTFPPPGADVTVSNLFFIFPNIVTLSPGTYGTVTVGGPMDFFPNILILEPGTYYVQNFSVGPSLFFFFMPQMVDVPTGQATVHVKGDVSARMGMLNDSGAAEALQFFFSDPSAASTMTIDFSTGNFVAAGRQVDIAVSASTVRGALAGNSVNLGLGASLDYPTELANKTLGAGLEGHWRLVRVRRHDE